MVGDVIPYNREKLKRLVFPECFRVSTIVTDTHMQTRHPDSNHTVNGVKRCGVTCVDVALHLIDYDGARLCLITAVTNGPIVHLSDDM
jgi:hypothetical protein